MSEETPKTDDPMVAALLRERAGYAGRKGKEDRVEAVDEQLKLRGYTPEGERLPDAPGPQAGPETKEPALEARTTPPKGRTARSTEKA